MECTTFNRDAFYHAALNPLHSVMLHGMHYIQSGCFGPHCTLLTRAGSPETDLEQRLQRYEEYAQLADRQLEILAGGGVSLENRQLFLDVPGVDQVHGTRVVF